MKTQSRSGLALVLFGLFVFLAACSTRNDDTLTQPENPQVFPESAQPLKKVTVQPGSRVFVKVDGSNQIVNEDSESMITGYLQSERGLLPTSEKDDADLIIRVVLEAPFPLGKTNAPLQAAQGIGLAGMGATLGLLIGSAADRSYGPGIGAAIGALAGLGGALWDNGGKYRVWGLQAWVGMGQNGRMPDDSALSRVLVRSETDESGQNDAWPGLEDGLARQITDSIVSKRQAGKQ